MLSRKTVRWLLRLNLLELAEQAFIKITPVNCKSERELIFYWRDLKQ